MTNLKQSLRKYGNDIKTDNKVLLIEIYQAKFNLLLIEIYQAKFKFTKNMIVSVLVLTNKYLYIQTLFFRLEDSNLTPSSN